MLQLFEKMRIFLRPSGFGDISVLVEGSNCASAPSYSRTEIHAERYYTVQHCHHARYLHSRVQDHGASFLPTVIKDISPLNLIIRHTLLHFVPF